jgi:hypothetical protein
MSRQTNLANKLSEREARALSPSSGSEAISAPHFIQQGTEQLCFFIIKRLR